MKELLKMNMNKYTKIQIFSVFLFIFSLFLNSAFFPDILTHWSSRRGNYNSVPFESWDWENILYYGNNSGWHGNHELANYLVVLSIILFIYGYVKKDEY